MTQALKFGVLATTEQAFWDSWEAAGIVDSNRNFTSEYPGIEVSTSWNGQVVKTPAVLDGNGNETTPAVIVNGWHCNVRVTGPLVAEMTYGLDQFDEDGNLKSIFDRTWATNIFQLTYQEADPATGFPAGYRNASGTVSYADPPDFSSPSLVWLI